MTLSEIKAAVLAGYTVYCATAYYKVVCDNLGQWLIVCPNGWCEGLTCVDGILQENESDFFIYETKEN